MGEWPPSSLGTVKLHQGSYFYLIAHQLSKKKKLSKHKYEDINIQPESGAEHYCSSHRLLQNLCSEMLNRSVHKFLAFYKRNKPGINHIK